MLGQGVGVKHLVPVALDHLEHDPMVQGDFYPGDLLIAVMDLPREYWLSHPEEAARIDMIALTVARALQSPDERAIDGRFWALLAARAWR